MERKIIGVVECLATDGRKTTTHYDSVLIKYCFRLFTSPPKWQTQIFANGMVDVK